MNCCLTQLIAISIKNIIVKKRNITATCCESFSHFILIILLIFGYNLSKVVYHSDMSYYTLKVNLPNEIYAVFDALGYQQTSESSPFTSISGILNLFDGPSVIPTFDEYILAS